MVSEVTGKDRDRIVPGTELCALSFIFERPDRRGTQSHGSKTQTSRTRPIPSSARIRCQDACNPTEVYVQILLFVLSHILNTVSR